MDWWNAERLIIPKANGGGWAWGSRASEILLGGGDVTVTSAEGHLAGSSNSEHESNFLTYITHFRLSPPSCDLGISLPPERGLSSNTEPCFVLLKALMSAISYFLNCFTCLSREHLLLSPLSTFFSYSPPIPSSEGPAEALPGPTIFTAALF